MVSGTRKRATFHGVFHDSVFLHHRPVHCIGEQRCHERGGGERGGGEVRGGERVLALIGKYLLGWWGWRRRSPSAEVSPAASLLPPVLT